VSNGVGRRIAEVVDPFALDEPRLVLAVAMDVNPALEQMLVVDPAEVVHPLDNGDVTGPWAHDPFVPSPVYFNDAELPMRVPLKLKFGMKPPDCGNRVGKLIPLAEFEIAAGLSGVILTGW